MSLVIADREEEYIHQSTLHILLYMAWVEPSLSERNGLFLYLHSLKIKFEDLIKPMLNGMSARTKLDPAMLSMVIYAFFMGTGLIMCIVMAFLDLAMGTHVLETGIYVMEGLNGTSVLQFLSGLFALLVGFSLLLDFLNIDIADYGNSNRSRHNRNNMGALSSRSKMIGALPKGKYGCLRRSDDANRNDSSSSSCAICLGCIGEEDGVRILPSCRHYFHISCIDRWLLLCTANNSSCPLCRVTVISNGLPSTETSRLEATVAL